MTCCCHYGSFLVRRSNLSSHLSDAYKILLIEILHLRFAQWQIRKYTYIFILRNFANELNQVKIIRPTTKRFPSYLC